MTGNRQTVEVPAHDLHRLLLAFRMAVTEGPPSDGWTHAADWSFERLADILDSYYASIPGHGIDPRTRCQHNSAYKWPSITGPARWIYVRTRERHLIIHDQHRAHLGLYRALCGFRIAEEDIVKRPRAEYRPCEVCEREQRMQGVDIEENGDAS